MVDQVHQGFVKTEAFDRRSIAPPGTFWPLPHHFRDVQEDMQAGVQKVADHYHAGGSPAHALRKGFREMVRRDMKQTSTESN